jgi:hypothetical protein
LSPRSRSRTPRGARTGYPFLDASPPRAPDIIYAPAYFPTDTIGSSIRIAGGAGGVESEWAMGAVIVWESTRYGATVTQAVGDVLDEGTVPGVLAVWHRAHDAHGHIRVLHARVGSTLVVISGTISWDELLRVADSLRRTTPQALML